MIHYPSPLGDVYLGGPPDEISHVLKRMTVSSRFLVVDPNTQSQCLPLLQDFIQHDFVIMLPSGETQKNIDQCASLWTSLIEQGADRESLIINLGGGVICDLGGFAASCFQRGVRFVQIPTTVTAMTDAAIGGKVGIDFKTYKNYIGLFRAPEWIWVYPPFIDSLPRLEKISGLAEIVKHAIIGSRPLWERLQQIRDMESMHWESLLELSIPVKLHAVATDPYDKGLRKTLNFGHTIGHALESYYLTTESPLTHGQAVTLGMMAESKLAVNHGLLPEKTFEEILELIYRLLAPPSLAIPDTATLYTWIRRDKKMTYGNPSYSLPDGIGSCRWDIMPAEIHSSIEWLQEHVSSFPHRFISNPH